jgi:hypothetical protein
VNVWHSAMVMRAYNEAEDVDARVIAVSLRAFDFADTNRYSDHALSVPSPIAPHLLR